MHSKTVPLQWASNLSDDKLNKAFAEFKKLADRKKEITEDDLFVLFTDQQIENKDAPVYELTNVQVQYGTANVPTATVTAVNPDGETVTAAATGAGSVEAIFNTLGNACRRGSPYSGLPCHIDRQRARCTWRSSRQFKY